MVVCARPRVNRRTRTTLQTTLTCTKFNRPHGPSLTSPNLAPMGAPRFGLFDGPWIGHGRLDLAQRQRLENPCHLHGQRPHPRGSGGGVRGAVLVEWVSGHQRGPQASGPDVRFRRHGARSQARRCRVVFLESLGRPSESACCALGRRPNERAPRSQRPMERDGRVFAVFEDKRTRWRWQRLHP